MGVAVNLTNMLLGSVMEITPFRLTYCHVLCVCVCLYLQVMWMRSIWQSWRAQAAVPHAHAQAARHPWWQWHAEQHSATTALSHSMQQALLTTHWVLSLAVMLVVVWL